MPLNQTWLARLKLSILDERGSPIVPELVKPYPGIQHIIGPGVIELQGGEVYQEVSLSQVLKTYPSVSSSTKAKISRSLLVLTTDTPGVYYSLASAAPGSGALAAPRQLTNFANDGFPFTAAPPYFDDETARYLNYAGPVPMVGLDDMRFSRVTDQLVTSGGYTGLLPLAPSGATPDLGESRFIWGRGNPQNLGKVNDGLVFCFWCKRKTDGSSTWFSVLSYPFDSVNNPNLLSADAGTALDPQWHEEMFPGHVGMVSAPIRVANITQPLDYQNRWRLIQIRKQDMFLDGSAPAGVDVDWSKITAMSFSASKLTGVAGDGDEGHYFSPVFLMSEAQVMRRLDTVAAETIMWKDMNDCNDESYYDRQGASLFLTAPPGTTARVQYFLGLV